MLFATSVAVADPIVEVQLTDDLSAATVTATDVGNALVGHSRGIWQNIDWVRNGKVRGRRVVIHGDSVTYKVRIDSNALMRLEKRNGQSDWTDWLLVPAEWSMDQPVTLTVRVPAGGVAILPFELIRHGAGETVYRAYPLLPSHGGFSAFGDFTVQKVALGDMSINTAIAGTHDHLDYASWTRVVADAARTTHGTLPGSNALIAIVPIPIPRGTVPWAHVKRGGGSHVIAYVNSSANLSELLDDWTLFHEVTHLYHPYLTRRDRWISEGIASYFQNIYRVRAGLLTPEAGWDLLLAGIERGRRENREKGGVQVADGGRMRTYWTAAVMALNADYVIRARTDKTLAIVMGEFVSKHLPAPKSWSGRDYLEALDAILGFELLLPMYKNTVKARYLPELLMDESAAIAMIADKR